MNSRNKTETCKRILAAALEEFASNGYSLTRLSDIGKRAGVAPSLVSKHFGNKEELFRAVLVNENSVYLSDDVDYPSLFDAFSAVAGRIKQEAAKGGINFRFAFMYLMSFDIPRSCYEEVGRLFDSSRLSEIIREEQKAGMLNDIEPYALFHMFLKSTVGLITAYLEAGLQLPDEKVFLYILGYKDEEKLREYTSAKKVL